MADQDEDEIQTCGQPPSTDTTTTTTTTSTSRVEEEHNTYKDTDSDCDSDSSVVTVVHSPLEETPLSDLQPLSAAAPTKAFEAPLARSSSSASSKARLPPPLIRPATAEQFPGPEPRPIPPQTNTFQISELPPRRHRAGSLVCPKSGIGSPPRFPAPPISQYRPSHLRSASASSTYTSSASRHRSALTEQQTNFSLPLRGFQHAGATESFPKLPSATSSTPSVQLPTANTPLERRRTRARSNAVRGENPLEVPITTQEYQLANLVQTINQKNEREAAQKAILSTREFAGRRTDGYHNSPGVRNPPFALSEAPVPQNQGHRTATFSTRQPLPTPLEDPIDRSATPTPRSFSASVSRTHPTQFSSITTALTSTGQVARTSVLCPDTRQSNIQGSARPNSFSLPTSATEPPTDPSVEPYQTSELNREKSGSSTDPKLSTKSSGFGDLQIWRLQLPPIPTSVLESIFADQHQAIKRANIAKEMNFQSYGESPQSGPSNPRQAPPSPSQGMNHQNGVNGGMAPGAGLIGYPTPAGHQSDLNYVMSMVDELANVLRMNQQLTANVVDKMGKVREKAKHLNLNNDELMAAAAGEMNDEGQNMDREISELRKSLEDSEYHKHENFKLAVHGAEILSDIADKVHKFKANHEADTLAWHKNYRKQLADEREENLRLRNEMNDLKAGASRANGHVRDMRRYLSDNDERHELRVENHRLRTEKRFWKRLALPLIPDDDSEWSDDDDLIDPEEKTRLEAALKEKERIAKDEGEGEGSGGPA